MRYFFVKILTMERLPDIDFLSHVEMLENTYTDRKEAKFLF